MKKKEKEEARTKSVQKNSHRKRRLLKGSRKREREGKKREKKSRMGNALIFHGRQEKNHIISLFTSYQRLNKRTTEGQRRGESRGESGERPRQVASGSRCGCPFGRHIISHTRRGRYRKKTTTTTTTRREIRRTTKAAELRVQSG